MKLFIVFDGIDGNGKTTQAKLLEKWLEEKGFSVFYTSEPSESEYGKTIEILLRKRTAASIPKEKWIELFTKDRKEHVKTIKAFLKQDKIVISDRYYYSTLAYQLSEEKWQDYASLFLKPDLTFILDLPATVAMERLRKKYKITKEKKAYFEKLKILRKARIEPILHFCCRDKNLIGMQADILGCAAVGIRNILFITGDPPKLGDYPFASAVFDVDSIGVVRIQDKLNRGIDLGGKAINQPTQTLIGVGADPNSLDMKREIRRTYEKAEAGAEYIITQPVFETAPLLKFLEKINKLNIPVLAGIWPLASYRNAEFMKNEVPGVIVPDDVMERMAKADTKQAQKEVGISIAREIVSKIRGYVAGIQVSAPFGNVGTAIEVIRG